MSFKVEKPQADFTIVCNAVLRDARLSLKAKGLYALMFSKPDGWIFYESSLIQESTEGRDAVRGAFKELLETGWLTKGQPRKHGIFEHNVYNLTVDWKSVDGSSVDGKPAANNTDIRKTDKKRERAQSLEAFLETGSRVEWFKWARERFGWSLQRCNDVFDTFRDYWRAQPGQKGLKADWEATWRNWCRRETTSFAQKPAPLQKGEIRVREMSAAENEDARWFQEVLRQRKLPENWRKSDDEIAKIAHDALYGDA